MNIRKIISLSLKMVVILTAVIGTFLSAYAGRGSFMGGTRVFVYFTIQSNIAIYGLHVVDTDVAGNVADCGQNLSAIGQKEIKREHDALNTLIIQ